jgi:hypothetical protein
MVEDASRITDAGVASRGSGLLYGQQAALGVHAEDEVELLLGDVLEAGAVAQTGIGHDDVQLPPVAANDVHDSVEVGDLRDVARHGDRVGADVLGRGFEFVLAAAGQVDAGAVVGKALGDRPSDTAGGPGDQRGLSVHGAHDRCPFDGARLHG